MVFWSRDSPPVMKSLSPVLEGDDTYTYHVGLAIDDHVWYCAMKGDTIHHANLILTLDVRPGGGLVMIKQINSTSKQVQFFEKLQSGNILSYTLDRNHAYVVKAGQRFTAHGHPVYDLLTHLF